MKPKLTMPSEEDIKKVEGMTWDDIRARAFSLPIEETDEHVLKLVQVCFLRSQDNPNDMNMQSIYKLACVCAMDNPVVFESAEPLEN